MTIQGTRVGVTVSPDRSVYRCAQCGITRPYRAGRGDVCRDCQDVLALDPPRGNTHPQKGTTA